MTPANQFFRAQETEGTRYCWPAEWEPHAATWLAWPHHRPDWPGKFEPIAWVWAEIVRWLSRGERVEIAVQNRSLRSQAQEVLERAHALNRNVSFRLWPTNRVWTRDSGCTFVVAERPGKRGRAGSRTRRLAGICWQFNAWAKYKNFQADRAIGPRMADAAGAMGVTAVHDDRRIVLEGGSIDGNGKGTLLTTEECLLSRKQSRNPGFGRSEYEALFAHYLGIRRVIWLGNGIAGDDTHGHVDDLARFVSADTVVTVVEADRRDRNYEPLRENLRRLRSARDQDGKRLNVVELPMPQAVKFNGIRLPASYANFYIANAAVLVPVFNDVNDRAALDILARLFPARQVVGIYAGDLVWGLGTIHCMTQQQPAA